MDNITYNSKVLSSSELKEFILSVLAGEEFKNKKFVPVGTLVELCNIEVQQVLPDVVVEEVFCFRAVLELLMEGRVEASEEGFHLISNCKSSAKSS